LLFKKIFVYLQYEKIVNTANSNMVSAPIVFWILWTLFTAVLIFLFYYAENNWLEDDRRKEDNREYQDISWRRRY